MSNGEHTDRISRLEAQYESSAERQQRLEAKVDTLIELVTNLRLTHARAGGVAAIVSLLVTAVIAPIIVAVIVG